MEEGRISFPKVSDLLDTGTRFTYLFRIDEEEYYLARIPEEEVCADLLEKGYRFERDWIFRAAKPKDLAFAGVTGKQLAEWYRSHRFCGACGHEMEADHKERMMRCPSCGNMIFPKVMPAVIVGVRNGDRLLCTKYRRGFAPYALIAGFTEIGETLEETCEREVMEEAGVRIKNITYFGSQPWGTAQDILAGFYCDVDGSPEIHIDKEELKLAEWKSREEIELQPYEYSLTNEIMKQFKLGNI